MEITNKYKNRKLYNWFIFSLSLIFFSRIFDVIGIPSVINFVHYGVFATIWIVILFRNYRKVDLITIKLLILLIIVFCSSFFNSVSIVNAFLEFLLLSQPFIIMIIYYKLDNPKKIQLESYLLLVAKINMVFSYIQYFLLGKTGDEIKGIFLNMGAGHHVNGAIALIVAMYLLWSRKLSIKIIIYSLAQLTIVFLCDNKQSIAALLISSLILFVINIFNIKKILKLGTLVTFLFVIIYFIGVYIYPPLFTWITMTKITGGLLAKFAIFDYLNGFASGWENVIFGYGPGMTAGRLAQVLTAYPVLYNSIASYPRYIESIMNFQQSNWMTNTISGSSFWSIIFSWSGVYGDLGWLGIMIIAGLYVNVLRKYCFNNFSKLIVISLVVHGFVFQWLEEPAFAAFYILICLLANEDNARKYKEALNVK